MSTAAGTGDRRLIEDWLPVNELSIENIRESPVSAMPAPNYLHVWWARRPLAISRAAVAASVLRADAEHSKFLEMMGTYPEIVADRARIQNATGGLKAPVYVNPRKPNLKRNHPRAFTHNLTPDEASWLRDNLATPDPLVVDITAGGGSIPFESGRLRLRSYANELNPVAALILRATCRWPSIYGEGIRKHYGHEVHIGKFNGIIGRYIKRVSALLEGIYPDEEQPAWMADWNKRYAAEIENGKLVCAERNPSQYLWSRTISCPSCGNEIPLSPNWRLDSSGKGIRLLPNQRTGACGFEIVETAAEQSAGTVRDAIATCPYSDCGATTPRGYIAEEAQAGRLGHRIYVVIVRDQWQEFTKAGAPKKRLTTKRHFRVAISEDNILPRVQRRLQDTRQEWDVADILPSEAIPVGNKTKEPHRYGIPIWKEMFSPRQQLAHGCCVQAFRELVDEDAAAGKLTAERKAAWCYVALALDKLFNRNSLMARWDDSRVVGTFDSHDFGMKWSHAEMPVINPMGGLNWALREVGKCIGELVELSGNEAMEDEALNLDLSKSLHHAIPTEKITTDSAGFLLSLDDRSVDAIVFDPPYYDNVSYAELSDFFYVWLKRTAGYIYPEWFTDLLTDKDNEAIASPVRFQGGRGRSVKAQAYEDYVQRMRNIFAECRRIIKDDGIMTIMFTHKTTDAWDALTVGIIQAGFRITATWPVKTESDSSLNIRDRAAARSTILLVCRPKHELNATGSSWESVQQQIRQRVSERLPQFREYGLTPLDTYLAAFGPALEVISSAWPIARDEANPLRPDDPFTVMPNDALEVARDVVFDARRQQVSHQWAESDTDTLTEFYILSQDATGSAKMTFDEANMVARVIGLEIENQEAKSLYSKNGANITLLTSEQRYARGEISPNAPGRHLIDAVHLALALTRADSVNGAIEWCRMQGFSDDAAFRGVLNALLKTMKGTDPDREPAQTLWAEMYGERPPTPEWAEQTEMQLEFGD